MFGLSRLRLGKRSSAQSRQSHSVRDYRALVRRKLKQKPDNRALALAQSIGAPTMHDFVSIGDGHVAVLRHHGLVDGMSIYDLGCGCGRTAQGCIVQDGRETMSALTSYRNCSTNYLSDALAIKRCSMSRPRLLH